MDIINNLYYQRAVFDTVADVASGLAPTGQAPKTESWLEPGSFAGKDIYEAYERLRAMNDATIRINASSGQSNDNSVYLINTVSHRGD
ncbi:MAG: hypothetical protein LBL13_06220 [Bacteroidales bacterium]|nr:hypothetical protein [Bacteroidales bacterium]